MKDALLERYVEKRLALSETKIRIVSGEGENGFCEEFNGKRSFHAIKRKVRLEASEGRWAEAQLSFINKDGIEFYETILDLDNR